MSGKASGTTYTHASFKHNRGILVRAQASLMKSVYTCNEFDLSVGGSGLFYNAVSQQGTLSVCVCVRESAHVNE